MNAYEIPNLRFSLTAGDDIKRHRFVAVDAYGNGIQAAAISNIIGVSMNEVSIGQVLEIADGIVMVEAATAVTAGNCAYSDENGRLVDFGDMYDEVGIIITSAAAGGLAAVKLK